MLTNAVWTANGPVLKYVQLIRTGLADPQPEKKGEIETCLIAA